MKPVPKKVQRIIAFIPGINLFCLPIFIYNSFFIKLTFKNYLRSLVYLVFPAIFVGILRKIFIYYFPASSVGFGHVCTYLILLIVGLRLISFQERYL